MLRYKVLNDCFRNRHRKYTIDDLVEACANAMERIYDDSKGVSKRTIQNDINNLQMPPYSISLDENLYDGRKRVYRYVNPEYSIPLFRISDIERDKLQDAIDVLDRYSGVPQYDWVRFCLSQVAGGIFMDDNRSIISFQNNPDLRGLEHFEDLLSAIAQRRPLKLKYQPYPFYNNDEQIERDVEILTVHPYHLKQYNNRWFLLALAEQKDKIGVYPLDRIVSFKPLQKTYIESDIDFEEYFDYAIGVSVRDSVEEIVVRVKKSRYNYIKSKPIHWTQTELKGRETADSVFLRFKVCINNELEALLLSYSNDLEVLSPDELRSKITERVAKMKDIYEV